MSDHLTLEDVLDAFAMEHDLTNDTLKRYATQYPKFALELSRLYHEIMTVNVEAEAQQEELQRSIAGASEESNEIKSAQYENLFTSERLKAAAKTMDLTRGFLAGFRDRVVTLNTIPDSFLKDFALALNTSIDAVKNHIDGDPDIGHAKAFKSTEKPTRPQQISFVEHVEASSLSAERKLSLLKQHGCD